MLYYLHELREVLGALNVFRYISFRAGGAVLTSLALSLALGTWVIAALRRRKIGQVQRTDCPASHLSKQGTPTMGGLLILATLVPTTLLWMRPDIRFTWLLLFVTGSLGAVGFWDDYLKLVRKDPRGTPSRVKFAVQTAVAMVVVTALSVHPPHPSYADSVLVPYAKDTVLVLGLLYSAFAILVIVGSSNAVNLTDGLDGLAAGNIIFCAIAYGVFAYAAGNVKFASYLHIIAVDGAGEISVFLAALIGSCLGFLWYNAHPAEVFM